MAKTPERRINVGVVGVGAQGRGDIGNFLAQEDVRVTAICDIETAVRVIRSTGTTPTGCGQMAAGIFEPDYLPRERGATPDIRRGRRDERCL